MKSIFLITTLLVLVSACYYDHEEELYPILPDNSVCDTSNVTFQTTIQPIIQVNCAGCHGNTNPEAGLSLTTYASIKATAESGKLVARIKGLGVNIMPPPPANPLGSCAITQIDAWISAGSPNN